MKPNLSFQKVPIVSLHWQDWYFYNIWDKPSPLIFMDSTDWLRRPPVPGRVLTMGHFSIITLMDLVKATAVWALPRVHAWSTGRVFSCMSESIHSTAQRWGQFPDFSLTCYSKSSLFCHFSGCCSKCQCMHWIIARYQLPSPLLPQVNVTIKHNLVTGCQVEREKASDNAVDHPGICSHAHLMRG